MVWLSAERQGAVARNILHCIFDFSNHLQLTYELDHDNTHTKTCFHVPRIIGAARSKPANCLKAIPGTIVLFRVIALDFPCSLMKCPWEQITEPLKGRGSCSRAWATTDGSTWLKLHDLSRTASIPLYSGEKRSARLFVVHIHAALKWPASQQRLTHTTMQVSLASAQCSSTGACPEPGQSQSVSRNSVNYNNMWHLILSRNKVQCAK